MTQNTILLSDMEIQNLLTILNNYKLDLPKECIGYIHCNNLEKVIKATKTKVL